MSPGTEALGGVDGGKRCRVAGCSFERTRSFAVRAEAGADVDASGNWWGTTNARQIAGLITDFNDNGRLGAVKFLPILTTPVNLDLPIASHRRILAKLGVRP